MILDLPLNIKMIPTRCKFADKKVGTYHVSSMPVDNTYSSLC